MTSLPPPLKIDRYFGEHGGPDKKYLCASEAEPVSMQELLTLADDECQAAWAGLSLGLHHPQGMPLLRTEIAKIHDVHADDVMVACPQEAIYIAMKCLTHYLGNSFHAVVVHPAYPSLQENLRYLGVDMDYWTVRYAANGWHFDVDELRKLIRPDTRLLIVNFPHNPTGFVPSDKDWHALIDLCREHNVFLFSDEMYRLSNNDGSAPLASACQLYERSMVLFGMSKTFGMPGLRIGWLACRDKPLMAAMMQFKDYLTGNPPGPCELLTLIALRNRHTLVERMLTHVHRNLPIIRAFCDRHPDIVEWHPPTACSTGFMKLKGWILKVGSGGATGFTDLLREATGILLLPASVYGFTDEYVRVGFGRAGIPQYLNELEQFIEKIKADHSTL